jgi:hypothetical protein
MLGGWKLYVVSLTIFVRAFHRRVRVSLKLSVTATLSTS